MEVRETFRSLDEWLAYINKRKLLSAQQIDAIGTSIHADGFVEPLTGTRAVRFDIQISANWREGLVYRGVNSRSRAVLREIELTLEEAKIPDPRIFAPEAVTAFALRLRGLYPRFLGSEYTDDKERLAWMYPIPFEDLLDLSLPNDSFDIVSTNEVLEHVPSIDKSLSELCRVLRPGGWHIGTHPFRFMHADSVVKSVIEDGKVKHLMEPEYHGNPMSNLGSLVFELPGWDILERARTAGFSDAFMRFVISRKYGCLSNHAGGIFVLCCRK